MVRMPRSSMVRLVMLIVNYHQSAICAMVGMACAVVRIFHWFIKFFVFFLIFHCQTRLTATKVGEHNARHGSGHRLRFLKPIFWGIRKLTQQTPTPAVHRTGQEVWFRDSIGPGNSEEKDERRRCPSESHQILHTGPVCNVTPQFFSSFRRRCFCPRESTTATERTDINQEFTMIGNLWHPFDKSFGNTTWFAQIHHIMSPTHATVPPAGAFCVLKL